MTPHTDPTTQPQAGDNSALLAAAKKAMFKKPTEDDNPDADTDLEDSSSEDEEEDEKVFTKFLGTLEKGDRASLTPWPVISRNEHK